MIMENPLPSNICGNSCQTTDQISSLHIQMMLMSSIDPALAKYRIGRSRTRTAIARRTSRRGDHAPERVFPLVVAVPNESSD
mmetsp:Transcript_1122/g.1823  ORF Transcript_1122/g.1823 Transcript_1122/m.1823 type:complete len:82 (-) Transcript_1122:1676-1921(-)